MQLIPMQNIPTLLSKQRGGYMCLLCKITQAKYINTKLRSWQNAVLWEEIRLHNCWLWVEFPPHLSISGNMIHQLLNDKTVRQPGWVCEPSCGGVQCVLWTSILGCTIFWASECRILSPVALPCWELREESCGCTFSFLWSAQRRRKMLLLPLNNFL